MGFVLVCRAGFAQTFYLESLVNNEQYKIRYKNFGISDGTTESLMNRDPKTQAHTQTERERQSNTDRDIYIGTRIHSKKE